VFSYNSRTDDVHIRNATSHSFDPISAGLLLLRFHFDAAGAASTRKSGNDCTERCEPHFLDRERMERRIGHARFHDGPTPPQCNVEAGSLVLRSIGRSLDAGISCTAELAGSPPAYGCRRSALQSESSVAGSFGFSNSTTAQMNQFLIEFQKVRDIYEKVATPKTGLLCITRVFEGCPGVRLYRDSWKSGTAEIFFAVWTDDESRNSGRIHYNIHAFKMRQFKGHVITSRDFADDFRKTFRGLTNAWPNIRMDFGPLNLMQGWIQFREETFERDVLELMNQFAAVSRIIDQLLQERIAPVRQRR
jgi:hypothetical protein